MKKRSRKPLNLVDKGSVIGICYICKKDITNSMIYNSHAVKIDSKTYRCRSKKCQHTIIDVYLKKMKSLRKTWYINPVTKIIPNKKKKTRAQNKQEFRKNLEEGLK